MHLQKLQHGKVCKVVRLGFAPSSEEGCGSNAETCDGYGILMNDEGMEIYFVDKALQNALLNELRVGTELRYLAEEGPLLRASKIWVVPEQNSLPVLRNEASKRSEML